MNILRPSDRLISIGTPGMTIVSRPSAAAAGGVPWEQIVTPTIAYRPAGAADQAASYVNIANPGTYNATAFGSLEWDMASGWILDGIEDYLSSNYDLGAGTNYTIVCRFSDVSNNGVFHYFEYLGRNHILRPNSGSGVVYGQDGATQTISPDMTSGVLAISNRYGYRDGAVDTTQLAASGGYNPPVIQIGRQYNSASYIAAYIQDWGFYTPAVTEEQLIEIMTVMAAGYDDR